MSKSTEVSRFYRIGNNLSLDFVNTEIADNGQKIDLLEKTADLAKWTAEMNLVTKNEVIQMIENWGDKSNCPVLLEQARSFRQNLRQMFDQIRHGATPENLRVNFLNDYLREKNNGLTEIVKGENGFEKNFRIDYREPLQILAVIAESAADLLCYGNFDYIKKCECEKCVLCFYDTTKNHKRRWCSMAGCGNRAKAAKFYQKKKAQS